LLKDEGRGQGLRGFPMLQEGSTHLHKCIDIFVVDDKCVQTVVPERQELWRTPVIQLLDTWRFGSVVHCQLAFTPTMAKGIAAII